MQENGKDTIKYYKNGEEYVPFFKSIKQKLFSPSKDSSKIQTNDDTAQQEHDQ